MCDCNETISERLEPSVEQELDSLLDQVLEQREQAEAQRVQRIVSRRPPSGSVGVRDERPQDPARVLRFNLAEVDGMAKERSSLKAEWTEPVTYRRGGPR